MRTALEKALGCSSSAVSSSNGSSMPKVVVSLLTLFHCCLLLILRSGKENFQNHRLLSSKSVISGSLDKKKELYLEASDESHFI